MTACVFQLEKDKCICIRCGRAAKQVPGQVCVTSYRQCTGVGVLKKAQNFVGASAKFFVAGMPKRTEEEISYILDDYCSKCEWYKDETCTHKNCGCRVAKKGWRNKLLWATERCPIGKWGPGKLLKPIQNLIVIACYFNPCGYRSTYQNYCKWLAGLAQIGIKPIVIELAFDSDEFILAESIKIRGSREKHLLWQKERLLNILIEKHLPSDTGAVIWSDIDILFDNPNWFVRAKEELSKHQVIQPWKRANRLQKDGSNGLWYDSFCSKYVSTRDVKEVKKGQPGFVWGARLEILRKHHFYENAVTGGGDLAMCRGFAWEYAANMVTSDKWQADIDSWGEAVLVDVQKDLSFVEGEIKHLYHGSRDNRKYKERWRILKEAEFDPQIDLAVDDAGLLTWTEHAKQNKAEMIQLVARYFSDRKEDE